MTRIHIQAPESGQAQPIDLAPGEAVILGRMPSAAAANGLPSAPRTVELASSAVSASHVAAWIEADGDSVCLRDLGSRNGTSLLLPPGATLSVRGEADFTIELAPRSRLPDDQTSPADAEWVAPRDYGLAIARAVESWFTQRRLAVAVTVQSGRDAGRSHAPTLLRLENQQTLVVHPRQTVDPSWLTLLQLVHRYVQRQNALFRAESEAREEGLVLASPLIRDAYRRVLRAAAPGGVNSLILLGPTGTGKEKFARAFHHHSQRAGRLVTQNAALFNKELLHAQLFGALKGAYSGSVRNTVGAVERADGGTLFLDEIGDLPREVQPMLLRFLDDGTFERLGAPGEERSADVRVVCATNRDLRAAARDGHFREDLWFRLSFAVIELPPLAERPEDVQAFLELRTLTGGLALWDALAPGARDLLLAHRWDGNFRELQNFATRAAQEGCERIDADLCRRLVSDGAIRPPGPSSSERPEPAVELPAIAAPGSGEPAERSRWPELAGTAAAAFASDEGHDTPLDWKEVNTFFDDYQKPLLFATLSGADKASSLEAVDLKRCADRLKADRGTAQKHIKRYFDRFRRP